ncbi:hypothetical protein D3C83_48780 [compost metagenome]
MVAGKASHGSFHFVLCFRKTVQVVADLAGGIHQGCERSEVAGAGVQPQQVEPNAFQRSDAFGQVRLGCFPPGIEHFGAGRLGRRDRGEHLDLGASLCRAGLERFDECRQLRQVVPVGLR